MTLEERGQSVGLQYGENLGYFFIVPSDSRAPRWRFPKTEAAIIMVKDNWASAVEEGRCDGEGRR